MDVSFSIYSNTNVLYFQRSIKIMGSIWNIPVHLSTMVELACFYNHILTFTPAASLCRTFIQTITTKQTTNNIIALTSSVAASFKKSHTRFCVPDWLSSSSK